MHRSVPLLVTLVATGALAACGQGGQSTLSMPQLTAEPVPVTSTITPTAEPSVEAPTVTETPTGTATEQPSRDPDDGDRGAFIRSFTPEGATDLDPLAADVDGDAVPEVVVSYLEAGAVQVDVAFWTGTAYEVTNELDGGEATAIDRTVVRDVNADGRTEIVVEFMGPGDLGGLSIWTVSGAADVDGLVAVGGCHAGRSTYGVVGAELEDRDGDGAEEIYASCDDSPLAQSDWTTDRYVWDGTSYRHLPSQAAAPVDAPAAPPPAPEPAPAPPADDDDRDDDRGPGDDDDESSGGGDDSDDGSDDDDSDDGSGDDDSDDSDD